ncbi:unnamed protein product [Cuscuta epithymum]|uniref:Uncharacterized protein n=1 Tax=Cuscuta epithymum TaxID=186058 RepID=A0AAV0DJQ4_9ASTE|nr:unnamed protein product [Cuscuta epithymum]
MPLLQPPFLLSSSQERNYRKEKNNNTSFSIDHELAQCRHLKLLLVRSTQYIIIVKNCEEAVMIIWTSVFLPFWATNFEAFGGPDLYLGGATRKRTRLLQPWRSRLSISLGRNRSEPLIGVFCKFHNKLIFSCMQ